jgi:exodeoxyribonuclease-3
VTRIPGAVSPLDEPRSITLSAGSLRIHTCYAPNGRKVGTDTHAVKLAWLSLFASWLEIDAADFPQRIVLGDLNVAPADDDVWDASRYRRRNLTSPPERAAFDRLLATGLDDIVRARLGPGPLFTWWNRRSDFYETDRGWRLDHVLTSPEVAGRVTSVTIDRAERGRPGSTDHAPILVELAPAQRM